MTEKKADPPKKDGEGRARGLGVAPRALRRTLLGVFAEDASPTKRRHVTRLRVT
jgi:hypothetical protein